jgi:hypothetical protein
MVRNFSPGEQDTAFIAPGIGNHPDVELFSDFFYDRRFVPVKAEELGELFKLIFIKLENLGGLQ